MLAAPLRLMVFITFINAIVFGCVGRDDSTLGKQPVETRLLDTEGCPLAYAKNGATAATGYLLNSGKIDGKPIQVFPDSATNGLSGVTAGFATSDPLVFPVTISVSACTTRACIDSILNAMPITDPANIPWDTTFTTPPLFVCDRVDNSVALRTAPNSSRPTVLVGVGTYHMYSFVMTGSSSPVFEIKAFVPPMEVVTAPWARRTEP